LDNDNDGLTDCEDPDCNGATDGSCTTGQPGICSTGTRTCQGGGEVCVPDNQPETEVCDNLDNDCDGVVDNFTRPTTCGLGECGATGVETCTAGTWDGDTCTPGTPAADDSVCNGLDDDCDGSTDEDYVVTATSCGTGECAATGQTTCVGGVEGDTCTPGTPQAEVCDNLDNDCDGTVDGITQSTTCGVGECGSTGTQTCTAGTWGDDTCTSGTPSAEVCDNLDNNCDGNIDEKLTQPTTCGVGECIGNTGIETCSAGSWGNDTCDPYAGATAETCDNLDNDCDGMVDYFTRPTSCGVGECSGNTGIEACIAGTWDNDTCDPFAGANPEGPYGDLTCDDLFDNDCDGYTDTDDSDCEAQCSDYKDKRSCNTDQNNCKWDDKQGVCKDRNN
jgi:hypothetical protein